MAEDDVELRGDPFGISHVFEYRHAAYRLLNGPADDRELLARPICYLARHALELALKTALVHADAEYHHAEIGYRPFEMVWVGHDLKALLDSLEHRLRATGNPELRRKARHVILRLHALDPDGQRFRYGKARAKGGETSASLPKGTRVNLTSLVNEMDDAIDALFDLDPAGPREERELHERIEALGMTQRLPIYPVEKGFGARRSQDGYVLLPTFLAPGLKSNDFVRLMGPDGFDLSWTVLGTEGPDYVLDWFNGSLRLPANRMVRLLERDECPNCSSRRITPIEPMPEETVVFIAGIVHEGDGPVIHSPDRMCRTCSHRFESNPSWLDGLEGGARAQASLESARINARRVRESPS